MTSPLLQSPSQLTAEQAARAREAALRAIDEARAATQDPAIRQLLQQRLTDQMQQNARPADLYQAARNQRRELENQLDRLRDERSSVSQRLRSSNPPEGADLRGLEARLVQLDARIAGLDRQIEQADAAVARAAAVPGAIVPPPLPVRTGPPEEVVALSALFMIVVMFPLALAYARRIWRRSAAALVIKPQELYDRFTRLEQSIDAVAIEVERIGENQRFLTKMQSQLGAGPAERIEAGARDREPSRRP